MDDESRDETTMASRLHLMLSWHRGDVTMSLEGALRAHCWGVTVLWESTVQIGRAHV
mgnify:CR=1 FL=1